MLPQRLLISEARLSVGADQDCVRGLSLSGFVHGRHPPRRCGPLTHALRSVIAFVATILRLWESTLLGEVSSGGPWAGSVDEPMVSGKALFRSIVGIVDVSPESFKLVNSPLGDGSAVVVPRNVTRTSAQSGRNAVWSCGQRPEGSRRSGGGSTAVRARSSLLLLWLELCWSR